MIRAQDQGGRMIPNLIYRMPAGVGGGFNHHLIGTIANNRASLSFVTGAHNMKFGYQGGFNNPSQTYQYFNEIIVVRLQQRHPEPAHAGHHANDSPARIKIVRNLVPTSFYAQDQWTRDRLTLQGGIRYDWYLTNYPDQSICDVGLHGGRAKPIVLPVAVDAGRVVAWTSRRAWALPTTCSATARRRSSSTSASTWKPFRRPTATST